MNWTRFLNGMPAGNYIFQNSPYQEQIHKAAELFRHAEAVLIGAGAGLSTSAGLTYGGKRFTDNFKDFIAAYGPAYMKDMYTAGFYPFTSEEEKWAYWSKHAMLNRVLPEALPLYQRLYQAVKEKEYFVITTNVDHQFYKAGFSADNIFAAQGDYGFIQCAKGCHARTYDGIKLFRQMDQARKKCRIPSYMIPKCPVCGGNMEMNLRKDQYFVEDENWNQAAGRYRRFLKINSKKSVLLLELGVGFNTPTIIRYPFEKMMLENRSWHFIRLNLSEAVIPEGIEKRAIGINKDIAESIEDISGQAEKGSYRMEEA